MSTKTFMPLELSDFCKAILNSAALEYKAKRLVYSEEMRASRDKHTLRPSLWCLEDYTGGQVAAVPRENVMTLLEEVPRSVFRSFIKSVLRSSTGHSATVTICEMWSVEGETEVTRGRDLGKDPQAVTVIGGVVTWLQEGKVHNALCQINPATMCFSWVEVDVDRAIDEDSMVCGEMQIENLE